MTFRIRKFIVGDEVEIYKLFHDAVHSINAKDYDEEQLNTWAPKEADLEKWRESLARNYTLVAIEQHF